MRTLVFLIAAIPAMGLNNSVTVYEATGTAQTGRPLSIARWFAKGEIAAYPAPYALGGAAISPWQADVKTRWDDGSVQFAIVSFFRDLPANGNVAIEFRNAADASSSPGNTGLTRAELLSFRGGAWGAKIETTASGAAASADARTMLAALAEAPDRIRCWLCGPVVTQMIVEDRSVARAYDWGYQGSPAMLVGIAASSATGTFTWSNHGLADGRPVWFSVNANYGGSLPGGVAEGVVYYVRDASANTFRVAASPGGSPLTLTTNGSGSFVAMQTYGGTAWSPAADDGHKSLHPIFVLTAYAGWPGVRIEYILESVWLDRVQDQWFDSMKLFSGAGNAVTAADMRPFEQASRSRWRKICWDGTAPAGEPACGAATATISPRPRGIVVDYNLPYLVHSGAVLPLDVTRQNVAFKLDEYWTYWTSAPPDARSDLTRGDVAAGSPPGTTHAYGMLHGQQYQTGGDYLIGLYPSYSVLHLYIMGDTTQTMTTRLRAAELAMDANYSMAHWSTHYREGDAARKYLSAYDEPAQTTPAFGKPVSLDARPSFTTMLKQSQWTDPADRVTVVGSVRMFDLGGGNPGATMLGITPTTCRCNDNQVGSDDKPHSWMPIWHSYLLLGDWYAMEEMQFWAAWYLSNADPTANANGADNYGRHGSWGLGVNPMNGRATAWHTRALGYAYVATPSADVAMKQHFLSKLRLNYYWLEGMMDVRNGLFAQTYPENSDWGCSKWNNSTLTLQGRDFADPYTAWAWGRCNQAGNLAAPLHLPLSPAASAGSVAPWLDPAKTGTSGLLWHMYYHGHVLEYLARLGVGESEKFNASVFRRMWTDSVNGMNFLMSEYGSPLLDQNLAPYTSWQAMRAAHIPAYANMWQWCEGGEPQTTPPNCNDFGYSTQHSYQHMYRALLALADTSVGFTGASGTHAADWALGNTTNTVNYGAPGNYASQVDPRFGWISQFIRNVRVSAGSTQAVLRWSSFSGDACRVGVSESGFASTNDSADDAVALSGRSGERLISGLHASTTYSYRITCGPSGGTVRASGRFTTAGAAGPSTVAIRLRPPASLKATTAVVDYGATPALGSSSAAVGCAGGCTVNVPASGGAAVYYRVRYQNGAGQALPTGSGVQTAMP